MGNGKVTWKRVSVILLTVIVVIMLTSILTWVFAMPSTMSGGAGSIIQASSEVSSLPVHLWDVMLEANPTDDMPSSSSIVGRVLAYAIVAFFEVLNWAI